MALLDTIKQRLQADTPPSPQMGGQTQSVRDLLRAKTGKAGASVTGRGPAQSALQEKVAQRQTEVAGQELQRQGQVQAEQFGQREADIAQREQQQEQQFRQAGQNAQQQMQRQASQLLAQFESGQKQLQTSQDIANLEQLGFVTRLQNDQYIKQLQDEGKRNRLDNELEFKKQLAQIVFQDQQDVLNNDIAFNRIMSADDRQFQEELAQMDINYAMQIADNAAQGLSARQTAAGVGNLVSAGVQAAGAMGIFNSTSNASPGASGAPRTGGQ